MLSHHELATLMLLGAAERWLETIDPDVLALRRYKLVEIREREPQGEMLQLTLQGRALLACLRTDTAG
ncbi:MAG: hypothetical protein CPDRYMAC_2291 [uncultured Paraburkholderia sp.]|nr:MAG: hypothetical protein CPDRYDRY_2261 [uncultured Paraburkholderia sp.]CAH2923692.1 MAG: hypothetical protein CPDRYMAC_2291 [uncultured Paraburkholderia sp.]